MEAAMTTGLEALRDLISTTSPCRSPRRDRRPRRSFAARAAEAAQGGTVGRGGRDPRRDPDRIDTAGPARVRPLPGWLPAEVATWTADRSSPGDGSGDGG
jgi:hypothetical protein